MVLNHTNCLQFIYELDTESAGLDRCLADYIRINGIYWAITSLLLLRPSLDPCSEEFDLQSPMKGGDICAFILSCQAEEGGFGGNVGHSPHLTFTLSAIQLLKTFSQLDNPLFEREKHCSWIMSLFNGDDGSFSGDKDGEIDNRFSYCALSSLSLMGELNENRVSKQQRDLIHSFIISCQNGDGSFGARPGMESHAGQVFCCVGALKILSIALESRLDDLKEWLTFRQLPCGGLNGRPEKLEDVCYSWWILSSLAMLDWLHCSIDKESLTKFILSCQADSDCAGAGGFADRPGDLPDIFHTLFGLAGLSLLGYPSLGKVCPIYCMLAV